MSETITRAEKKKIQREEKKQGTKQLKQAQKKLKKIRLFSQIALSLIILIAGGSYIYQNSSYEKLEVEDTFSEGQVHWHATIKAEACGKEVSLSKGASGQFVGTPGLHSHNDGKIHMEGLIKRGKDVGLGRFLDNIGFKFSQTRLGSYKNEDNACNNEKDNKVSLLVNGEESNEFRDYVIRQGDILLLKYE